MPPVEKITEAEGCNTQKWKWALGLGVAVLVAAASLLLLPRLPPFENLWNPDAETLRELVARAGLWGPFLIVAFMIVAVVASPIPSAPIAMAAGAAYGHVMGSVYVLTGAEIGALIAFLIARNVGRVPLRRWFGDRTDTGLLGSQNALTYTVFVTRLMPFVSFDMISYAAGLSSIKFWRFALATLAGIVPASFLLAHFGDVATQQDSIPTIWIALALGLATGVPLLVGAMRWLAKRLA
ncbi:TVP38/TMEM64 family protein [Tropicimonas marinistellae]|uniref:TVP38/TMEM64 family protein n=1 Tax=Tropicimonas marinistellae TaxID=1739787 RepID=UPI00098E9938|nr:TVP38/TMEM64 family protein [Tropicimonas marinistellae]